MAVIHARERLEHIADLGLALSSQEHSMDALCALAEQAFSDDPEKHGQVLEAITRKRR